MVLDINDGSGEAQRTVVRDSALELHAKISVMVERIPAYSYEWKEESSANGIMKQVIDDATQEMITYYLHPVNFSITYKDVTSDMNQDAADKLADENELTQIRGMLSNINNSSLPAWHKKLLKRLIRKMR